MHQLWGFGTAAVDFRIITAEYGEGYKDKLLAQQTAALGGGAAANCLVQAARLGVPVGWLGKLGCDPIGRQIVDLLRSEEINCEAVIYSQTVCSPFNVAVYAGEHRRRIGGFLLPNALQTLTDGDLFSLSHYPQNGDWLAIEVGEIPLISCLKLARMVKSKGVRIALDVDLDPIRQCGADRETVEALLGEADLLIPNVTALSSLYDQQDPQALCRLLYEKFGVPTVVTAGADGAYFADADGALQHQAARPVTVKDTVGAGDAFHGGLLSALVEDLPLPEAVKRGALCGALNCTAFGAREGMPDRATLLAAEKENV